jgi:hypothetical protein
MKAKMMNGQFSQELKKLDAMNAQQAIIAGQLVNNNK